jgi:hypothetical protein
MADYRIVRAALAAEPPALDVAALRRAFREYTLDASDGDAIDAIAREYRYIVTVPS